MRASINARLGAMMFLNYVVWGAWYVTIGTWLTATLHFSGTQTGEIFGTTALASMISPFFAGLVADRYFRTERVLSALHLIGAVLLYFIARSTSFTAVYTLMLAYCICFFPTLPLTNSLTLRHVADAGKQFPLHTRVRHHRLDRDLGDHRLARRGSIAKAISHRRRMLRSHESLLPGAAVDAAQ